MEVGNGNLLGRVEDAGEEEDVVEVEGVEEGVVRYEGDRVVPLLARPPRCPVQPPPVLLYLAPSSTPPLPLPPPARQVGPTSRLAKWRHWLSRARAGGVATPEKSALLSQGKCSMRSVKAMASNLGIRS